MIFLKKFSETRISDSIFLKKYSATIIVSSKNLFIPNPSSPIFTSEISFPLSKNSGSFIKFIREFNE